MKPSAEVQREFQKLRSNRLLVEYLQAAYEAEKEKLVTLPEDEQFRVIQGRAQKSKELINLIVGDPKSLNPAKVPPHR